jgi:hypothetical protein
MASKVNSFGIFSNDYVKLLSFLLQKSIFALLPAKVIKIIAAEKQTADIILAAATD